MPPPPAGPLPTAPPCTAAAITTGPSWPWEDFISRNHQRAPRSSAAWVTLPTALYSQRRRSTVQYANNSIGQLCWPMLGFLLYDQTHSPACAPDPACDRMSAAVSLQSKFAVRRWAGGIALCTPRRIAQTRRLNVGAACPCSPHLCSRVGVRIESQYKCCWRGGITLRRTLVG